MTPDQIRLVQESFASFAKLRHTGAERFYARLFELDPSLRPMFHGDLASQGSKLMTTLALVVRSLDDLGPLLGTIDMLGRRHQSYGVTERHFGVVGDALIWTLAHSLGDALTPETRAAWTTAYAVLSGRLIAAMKQKAQAA